MDQSFCPCCANKMSNAHQLHQHHQHQIEAEDDEDPWTRAEKDGSRHQGPFFDSTKKRKREITS